jgi:HSP20 family protein
MASVAVQRIDEKSGKSIPLLKEIEKRLQDVRRRAFELFEMRGGDSGHDFDDWIKAEREVMGWPAAELKEKDSKYELDIALPGFDAKEVQVTATSHEIIVHAESRHEKKGEEGKCLWTEFGSKDVYRRIELPEPIAVEKTNATIDKGVLRITAAKLPVAQAKQIEVKVA